MSQTSEHPLETVLHLIAAAAPQPWYYQQHAKQYGYDPAALGDVLELLWLEGLVQREGTGSAAMGPGVALTPLGQRVLQEPELRDRLRNDQALTNEPGPIVRGSLRHPITPWITRLLLLANLAMFGYCIWLARGNEGARSMYLGGRADAVVVNLILHPAGAVGGIDLLRGEWWRLLTACFVHGGVLHILMNMYTLHVAGRFVEQTWGHWRYFLIYAIAGWGGSCLAMAQSPGQFVVGASGALCGVLAADGVWIYLNGRHLPRAMASRGKSGFLTTLVLMVVISFLPGISYWGHLGGALAGAVAALALHFQRFGGPMMKLLGLVAVLAVPFGCYAYLQDQRVKNKAWNEVEFRQFNADVVRKVQKTMRSGIDAYREVVKAVRDRHPERREQEEVEKAVQTLGEQLGALRNLESELSRAGPYGDAEVEKARRAALEYTRTRIEVFEEARRCLEAGTGWKRADEKKFDELWQRLREQREAWEALLR